MCYGTLSNNSHFRPISLIKNADATTLAKVKVKLQITDALKVGDQCGNVRLAFIQIAKAACTRLKENTIKT